METINAILGELTYNDLDQWAGEKIRTRGKSYIERVDGLQRTSDDELAAWVSGTEEYATLVHLDEGGEHDWFCTCPYEWGPCKHAVAVILAAAQRVKQKQEIPLLDKDDDLYLILFGEQEGEMGQEEEEVEDEAMAAKKGNKKEQPKIRKLLDAKSREELLDLLVALAADYPEVERTILEAEQLRSGLVDPLIRSLRLEIKYLTSEPAWSNHWNDEGFSPDYSHVRQQFKELLAASHSDALLDLGDQLLREGTGQVEQSDDEGETAGDIGECLDLVLEAVPQSSLSKPQQLLWVIDRLLEDEFDLLHSGETLLKDDSYTQAHWHEVAVVLADRMAKDKSKPSAASGTYRRERLMERLIQAYRLSGQPEQILPLMINEVDRLRNYSKLVDTLLAAGSYDQARQWCIHGFDCTVKEAPGSAEGLQQRLRQIAEAEQRHDLVAAHRAQEFFHRPYLESYKELRKTAEKLGCWPIVRAGALGFLETGKRPDLPGKKGAAATWPLPEPEVCFPVEKRVGGFRHRFPDLRTLINIAIFEKRQDDVVSLYQAIKNDKLGYWDLDHTVAKAVAKSHPELALGIWRTIVDRLIAEVKPKAYVEASGYLVQMRKVFETCKRQADWQRLLAELRQTHKAKRRLMEVLDSLSHTSKKIIE